LKRYHERLDSQRDSCDATSVAILVEELRAEPYDPVLCYKPEHSEVKYGRSETVLGHHAYGGDLFVLVLMTESQDKQLMKNGWKVICSDTTYDVTSYRHKLMSLVVKDEYGFGYVVATCLTNYEDETTYQIFFQAVCDRVPKFQASCFMADNSTPLKNAARKVFGASVKILNCDWHTDLNWNRNSTKINNKKERQEILCLLRMALKERSQAEFNKFLNCLFVNYSHCKEFLEYFSRIYMGKINEWAHHHRNFFHDDVDTNMLSEAWHNILKTIYMRRYPKRRLDQTVEILLIAEEDRYKTDVRREFEGVSCRKKEHNLRHGRGLAMKDDVVTTNVDGSWSVKSATSDLVVYKVTRLAEECYNQDHCFSVCMELPCFGLCGHVYSCTCLDRALLCKHVHKVHSFVNRGVALKVNTWKIN
jgi:MULE transposase domain